ncbi:hypothetical protein N7465_010157 [Penicillium sp. CMV-2018d]|nr:hypothetical protein N7465_010157 [Penicillium sp. CMV-2018d]
MYIYVRHGEILRADYIRRNFVLELLILLLILFLMLLRHIGNLTPFAFVGLFAFFFVVWTSPGLDISSLVTVKHSHWNGCAAHSSLIHAN